MRLWHAVKGASKYAAAVAAGDAADAIEAGRRAALCGSCPNRRDYRVPALGVTAAFCGPAFEDHGATCGCLVQVSCRPAGKVCVRSESCPSGKW